MAGTPPARNLRADAFRFAREAHASQRRQTDRAAYVNHPVDVADLLEDAGYGEEVVAAALLHDVIEDTDVSAGEIERRFGARVAALVAALTENADIAAYEDRKAEHRARIAASDPDAAAIFLADKLANARELRAALGARPDDLDGRLTTPLEAKLRHYEQTLELIGDPATGEPLASELSEELSRLRAEVGAPEPAEGSRA